MKNRKADLITRDDLLAPWRLRASVGASSANPEFVGQTKDRLWPPTEAARSGRKRRPRPFRYLARRRYRNPPGPSSISSSSAPRNGLRRRAGKGNRSARSATKKPAPAGQADRLFTAKTREGTELFIVEGDSCWRLRQRRPQPRDPGPPPPQGQDPERPWRGLRTS